MPASSTSRRPSSSGRNDDGGGGGGNGCSWAATERVASYLQSQRSVHAVCKRHGVNTTAFTPIPAGDRRACSPPPAGSVCMHADALEAGMRVPLDPFCREVLSHYGVAPSQLSPNCWRILAAFLALSRAAGVPQPPSVPVFRRFFYLRALKVKGLYCFATKDTAGVLFTGLPVKIKGWKESFFFLKAKVVAVKSEPGWSWTPLSGKKRPAESNQTKEATGHGSVASVPAGFSTQPQHARGRHDEHDGGDMVEWETARQLLLGVITPARERAFLAAADPFTVIARSYTATLQAANYATFSMGHALKLQEDSKEHERRLEEEALKGYELGMEDMKRVALRLRPDIDAAQLFVAPDCSQQVSDSVAEPAV